MAIRSFTKYLHEQHAERSRHVVEHSVSKAFEFNSDGFEIIINISLAKHEQHQEAIQFLRRVADELAALEKASRRNK
jgi:hypothetical protein